MNAAGASQAGDSTPLRGNAAAVSAGVAVPTGATLEAIDRRLADWLLEGPAQLRSGPQRGAVAGLVDADGRAEYAYPEITGYYLQWLAWQATRHGRSEALAARAEAAQHWLGQWLADAALPRTRIHLGSDMPDWRNDCGVHLRRRHGAARRSPRRRAPGSCGPPAASSRESIACWASWSGTMACSTPVAGGRERASLPDRWSTRRGAFLAKAAAGVIDAATVVPGVSAPVVEAAERTLAASLRWLDERPHREVHPLLYAAEGFLSLPAHPLLPAALPVIARELAEVLRRSRALGRVPEFLDVEPTAAGAARLDIVAQTLRVAALLAAHGVRESLDAAELRPPAPTPGRRHHAAGNAAVRRRGAAGPAQRLGDDVRRSGAGLRRRGRCDAEGWGRCGAGGLIRRAAEARRDPLPISLPRSLPGGSADRHLGNDLAPAPALRAPVLRAARGRSPSGGDARRSRPDAAPAGPGVSVVIPERDTPEMLAGTLAALMAALDRIDEPRQVIVVVNGAASERYAELQQRFPAVVFLHWPRTAGLRRCDRARAAARAARLGLPPQQRHAARRRGAGDAAALARRRRLRHRVADPADRCARSARGNRLRRLARRRQRDPRLSRAAARRRRAVPGAVRQRRRRAVPDRARCVVTLRRPAATTRSTGRMRTGACCAWREGLARAVLSAIAGPPPASRDDLALLRRRRTRAHRRAQPVAVRRAARRQRRRARTAHGADLRAALRQPAGTLRRRAIAAAVLRQRRLARRATAPLPPLRLARSDGAGHRTRRASPTPAGCGRRWPTARRDRACCWSRRSRSFRRATAAPGAWPSCCAACARLSTSSSSATRPGCTTPAAWRRWTASTPCT